MPGTIVGLLAAAGAAILLAAQLKSQGRQQKIKVRIPAHQKRAGKS